MRGDLGLRLPPSGLLGEDDQPDSIPKMRLDYAPYHCKLMSQLKRGNGTARSTRGES